MFGIRFGVPRRKASWASLPVILVVFLAAWGYDDVCRSMQAKEDWQGTVVRTYDGSGFGRSGTRRRYWDVRTADGSVRSVRIYSRNLWYAAHSGDFVIKQAGQLDPIPVRHR